MAEDLLGNPVRYDQLDQLVLLVFLVFSSPLRMKDNQQVSGTVLPGLYRTLSNLIFLLKVLLQFEAKAETSENLGRPTLNRSQHILKQQQLFEFMCWKPANMFIRVCLWVLHYNSITKIFETSIYPKALRKGMDEMPLAQ